jgi:FlaA1/EpsC-like NDP-sugar epimerase
VLSLVMGLPRIKLSAFDMQSATRIAVFAAVLGIAGTGLNMAAELGAPRTVPMIFGFLLFCISIGWKLAASQTLDRMRAGTEPRVPVAVYGAGAAGIQLISMLQRSGEFRIVAVVDDNPGLRGVAVGGLRVQNPAVLEGLARSGRIRRILLAMPSVPATKRREIARALKALPVEVHALPPYAEMVGSGSLVPALKPVSTDDLLGRDKVDLDLPGMVEAYRGRSVLVSGAGGSIGSELCRQILTTVPRRLVLFERSEYALYEIERELAPLAAEAGVELVAVLGSVTDPRRVARTFEAWGTEIVLHAAAYKHVPLVEANELEGVRNNVFGTRIIAEAAEAAGVERFILISTDKAVRPTNVMGATKRLAEMVVQDLARRARTTRFAMVRFGNVLGSSGSVIPLFQRQITAGGPVTVTHREVTRFFMTVPEAARLVLLAGSYAEGGEVFVLDMGKPVKIIDLARQVVELSGLTVRDADNPDGDIEIAITGLRPGEKLYEELLIGADGLLKTPHPKILCAGEHCPARHEIARILTDLDDALEADCADTARQHIALWVEGQPAAGPAVPAASVAAE